MKGKEMDGERGREGWEERDGGEEMEKAMREANESFYYNILTYLQLLSLQNYNKTNSRQ